ncbi:MAG: 23S rRNA (adenine(2503)-C(2))-methyltransferase RlmN [Deltaproteobacteria bacterium]|nr:23S rRNA (adenine(2503)-C(2))-methyltransferase RlmN [Deltaproteobacteria bacterium]
MNPAIVLSDQPVIDFFNLEIEEAERTVGELIGKKFHGSSFASYVYKHYQAKTDEMFSIPADAREKIKDLVDISPLPILKKQISVDGTVKFLLQVQTPKGPEQIECVYLPDPERVTLCVSSQVGCKMACKFCLTAQLGFKHSLTAGDIVRQIWTVEQEPELRRITNIVFMGMGEPFDNFDEVKKATRILTHPKGFNKSARKITVSTVGIVEKINALTKEDPFKLAISLNGTTNEIRSKIMPINNRWKIEELMSACREYSKRTNKRVTFEYILMKDVSDSVEDAHRLGKLTADISCKINLIPYNESPFTEFKRPSDEQIAKFHSTMLQYDNAVFTRKNRGNDIFAACGMLKKVDAAAKPAS